VFLVQLYDISIAYAPCTKTSNVERVENAERGGVYLGSDLPICVCR